jgi:hypothetical protein
MGRKHGADRGFALSEITGIVRNKGFSQLFFVPAHFFFKIALFSLDLSRNAFTFPQQTASVLLSVGSSVCFAPI